MLREHLTAREIAGAAGVSRQAIQKRATRESWACRQRQGRGGGVEYRITELPADIRAAISLETPEPTTPRPATPPADRATLWAEFERKPQNIKDQARRRLRLLDAVEQLVAEGEPKTRAYQIVSDQAGESAATLYRWAKTLDGIDIADRLPALAPRWSGRQTTAECSVEAWDYFRSDYLRPERPTARACYDRLSRAAHRHGWDVPSYDTLLRRVEREIPRAVIVLARDGEEGLKRTLPAQERDRSVFHALEAVNADGHKFDVFVRWPDGEVGRPILVAWQDIYSGKVLSWRIDKTENTDAIRLSFGDLVETYGIPSHTYLDNGRGFASKWMTGGTPTRYRFKIKAEEPEGILNLLGVRVHWATPYHGQAKPIERAFRDLAEYISKHPALAGAYTGNKPDAKPENYGSRAVTFDEFLQVVGDEIRAHNARTGRRAKLCAGRSFDETFRESYERSAIRKATAEQRRLWLLAAEGVSCSRQDASITFMGNRYWSESLGAHAGRRVIVRFDPEALLEPLHVYTQDGRYIGPADCIQATGFNDTQSARELARLRRQQIRNTRQLLDTERRIDALELAKRLPQPDEPEEVEARIVRPFRPQLRTGTDSRDDGIDVDTELGKVVRIWRPEGI